MKLHELLSEAIIPRWSPPKSAAETIARQAIPGRSEDTETERNKLKRLLKSNKQMRPVADEVSKDPDHKFVGAGLNAYVSRTDNQHSLDRVHRTSKFTEGTTIYLEFIRTHPKLHNNPLFPKVRGSQSRSNGAVTMHVERLVPFATKGLGDNVELLLSVWERYLDTRPAPTQNEVGDNESDADFLDRVKWRLVVGIEGAVDTGWGTSNPEMRQVHNVVQHIRNLNPNMLLDVHAENMMWRLTSVGPQLVITDPLWAGWESLETSL